RAEVYYECMEPFKSLMCLWVMSTSIAAIWMEKVVTPLIDPAIKEDMAYIFLHFTRNHKEQRPIVAVVATYFLLRRCLKANKRAEVYYECMEPFKSLMCLWVMSTSIAAIWMEKVVTPLIEPAIKGFAAAPTVLKPKRIKVDRAWTQAAYTKATDQIIESVHRKCFGENVGQLVIGLDKVQLNRTLYNVLLDEMVSDRYMFRSRVLNRVAGYGYG
nr:hypothetical protein [Tanacetum cinerariifolium]